jgi:hypothetical protein
MYVIHGYGITLNIVLRRQILFYPLSACLALAAILLKHPADVRARSHLRHISDFVKFLINVQKCGVLDVERMLHLCIELEKLVFKIVTAEKNVAQSTEFSVGDYRLHAKVQVSPKGICCEVNSRLLLERGLPHTRRFTATKCNLHLA